RFQMMMTQGRVRDLLQLFAFDQLHVADAGGRTQVIHDRISFVEAFGRDDVFVGDAFVLVGRTAAIAMEPDVMLAWNLAELVIVRHLLPPIGCLALPAPSPELRRAP